VITTFSSHVKYSKRRFVGLYSAFIIIPQVWHVLTKNDTVSPATGTLIYIYYVTSPPTYRLLQRAVNIADAVVIAALLVAYIVKTSRVMNAAPYLSEHLAPPLPCNIDWVHYTARA